LVDSDGEELTRGEFLGRMDEKNPPMYMPYRCLIPRNVNNMLVSCRAFSSDAVIDMCNPGFDFCRSIAGTEKVVLPLHMPGRSAP